MCVLTPPQVAAHGTYVDGDKGPSMGAEGEGLIQSPVHLVT